MPPWGAVPGFLDQEAKWIWFTPNANISAPGSANASFMYRWNNTSSSNISAKINIIVDNKSSIIVNNKNIGEQKGGWRESGGLFNVTLQPGPNDFVFNAANVGNSPNPAGLLVSVLNNNNKVLFRTGDNGWKYSSSQQSGFVSTNVSTQQTPPAQQQDQGQQQTQDESTNVQTTKITGVFLLLPVNHKIKDNIKDKIQGFYQPYLTDLYLSNNPNATFESLGITDFNIFDSRINFKNRNGFVISKANNNPNEPWWFLKHSNHGVILQTQSQKVISDKWQYYNNNKRNHTGTHGQLIGSVIFSIGTINKVIQEQQTPPAQNAPPSRQVPSDIINNILNDSKFQKSISDLTERKINEFSKSGKNANNIFGNNIFRRNIDAFVKNTIFEFSKMDQNIDNILDNSKFKKYISDSISNKYYELNESNDNDRKKK